MSKENNLMKTIQLALGKLPNVKLFRNNTGMGWQGTRLKAPAGVVTLSSPRPLDAGLCKGSSDLIGWTSVVITPEMVGKTVALFTAIEVKNESGRITVEQQNFIEQVSQAGGIAGIVRSPEFAEKLISYHSK